MIAILMLVALVVLVANVTVALVTIGRRAGGATWLLVILLTGTTGAAAMAVLVVWASVTEPSALWVMRWAEVGLLLTGVAVLGTAVWFQAWHSRAHAAAGQHGDTE